MTDPIRASLKKFREARNLTQAELAERLGVGKQAVYMWESGQRGIPLKRLEAIARELGTTRAQLVGGVDDVEYVTHEHTLASARDSAVADHFATIPFFDFFAAPSPQSKTAWRLPLTFIRQLSTAPVGNLAFVQIVGDRLAPLLNPDDLVLIDLSSTSGTSDALYIVIEGDTLVARRLAQKQDAKTGNTRIVGRIIKKIGIV